MQSGLLLIERIVIESLSKKEMNLNELEKETNLNRALLLNLLPNLLMKGYIVYSRGVYNISKENCFKWLSTINAPVNLKEEAREIFNSLVNQYFTQEVQKTSELKIQKMWLTVDEEKVLNSHLINLESFFKSVKQSRKTKPVAEKTCEQRVVVWATTNYSELITGALRAV